MTTETNSTGDADEQPEEQTDINQPPTVDEQLDTVLNVLTDHLDEVASVLADIRDEKYGKFSTTVDNVKWTLKHENGSVEWFRRSVDNNDQYIISTKEDPSPSTVAEGMKDYPKFINSFNDWVDGLAKALEPTAEQLSDTEALVDQIDAENLLDRRDSLETEAWNVASHVGHAVAATTGNEYGTFKTSIDEKTWTLKYQDNGSAKYLQVGNTYVLGRDSPHPKDLADMVQHFEEWIASVNSWLDEQNETLRLSIDITETEESADDSN